MKVRKDSGSPLVIHQGVAELGHELGNVLNGLLGMTRLVRDSGLNAEQEYWLRAIEQSGCQMRRLVDAFWLGPTPTGEFIHPNPVDLDGIELLEQALLAHAPAARRNADRLLLTVAPDLPRYWHCDPCLLRQLLDNLLGNALKFTRSGEVVLEVAARLEGNDPTDTLLLAVIDSGPGIDAALGRRMFRAYERGLDPVREESAGYGLGRLLDEGVGGLMNITGASSALDEMRGISRPEGQSGDYSLSSMGADAMTGIDQSVTGAMRSLGIYDEERPAYTQSLGWRLAEILPSWMQ